MVEWFNDRSPHHLEPAAQIILDCDTQFVAGLGKAQKSVAAIPADLTPGSGADLPPCDVTADVVFRSVGMERDFRPLQHHQQFGLVGVQPRQQAVQRDEASTAKEDAVEACAQRPSPPLARFQLVSLEVRVKIPDQAANSRLRAGSPIRGKPNPNRLFPRGSCRPAILTFLREEVPGEAARLL